MTFADLNNSFQKKFWVEMMVKMGGLALNNHERYLPNYKQKYYILYEEDISNMLSETDTIITKN